MLVRSRWKPLGRAPLALRDGAKTPRLLSANGMRSSAMARGMVAVDIEPRLKRGCWVPSSCIRYSTGVGRTHSMARGRSQIAPGCLKICFQRGSNLDTTGGPPTLTDPGDPCNVQAVTIRGESEHGQTWALRQSRRGEGQCPQGALDQMREL